MVEEIVKGDIDGDRRITKIDLLLLQKYLINEISFDERQLIAADVNNDGKVSLMDMTAIAGHLKGIKILTEVVEREV